MPKATSNYYAVARGRAPGIYTNWQECEAQVKGFVGAKYKKFHTIDQAEEWKSEQDGNVNGTSPSRIQARSSARPYPAPHEATTSASTSRGQADASTLGAVHAALADGDPSEAGKDVVYCDGACKGNGRVGSIAGVGVWWGHKDPRNIAERCPGGQTNNRAELIAIIRVLETTPKSKRPLLIKTDSQYSIKCFKEWLPKWRSNGFRSSSGGAVANQAVIKYLDALLSERGFLGQRVELKYVQGHVGIVGNEGADGQANLGCGLPEVEELDWASLEAEVLQRIQERKTAAPPASIDSPAAVASISALKSITSGATVAFAEPADASTAETPDTASRKQRIAQAIEESTRSPAGPSNAAAAAVTSPTTRRSGFRPAGTGTTQPPPSTQPAPAAATTRQQRIAQAIEESLRSPPPAPPSPGREDPITPTKPSTRPSHAVTPNLHAGYTPTRPPRASTSTLTADGITATAAVRAAFTEPSRLVNRERDRSRDQETNTIVAMVPTRSAGRRGREREPEGPTYRDVSVEAKLCECCRDGVHRGSQSRRRSASPPRRRSQGVVNGKQKESPGVKAASQESLEETQAISITESDLNAYAAGLLPEDELEADLSF